MATFLRLMPLKLCPNILVECPLAVPELYARNVCLPPVFLFQVDQLRQQTLNMSL